MYRVRNMQITRKNNAIVYGKIKEHRITFSSFASKSSLNIIKLVKQLFLGRTLKYTTNKKNEKQRRIK